MPDSPTWVTLTDDERVLWHEHPAIHPYLIGELGSLLLVVLGSIIALAGLGSVGLPGDLPVPDVVLIVVGGLLLVVGVVGIAWQLITWWSHRYLVTTREVYKKSGIISRTVTKVSIENVQETSFDQSVVGRLLSYGDVHIATAGTGGTEIVFRHAANPTDVVALITEQHGR